MCFPKSVIVWLCGNHPTLENNCSRVLSEAFLEFYNFPKFSENFESILVNVRFQFCLAAEYIGQDGAILPNDQPIILRESRAG